MRTKTKFGLISITNIGHGQILREAKQIQQKIRNVLSIEEYNYVLFVDANDIELCITLLVAATQCSGISLYFDTGVHLIEGNIYLNEQKVGYKKVEKNEAQNKGLVITKTSGTTGDPKYILYSLENKIDRARQMKSILNVNKEDKMLLTTKLNHSLGLRILFTSLISECRLDIPDNMSSEGIKNSITRKPPTKLIVVSLVLANALGELENCRDSIKAIMLSSSSASERIKREFD